MNNLRGHPRTGSNVVTQQIEASGDPDLTLLLPECDVEDPELSIVIPSLNEEITIATFVAWCKQGIADAGIAAEILIIDSSKDRTAEIAVANGARVLRTPRRGLGRAYIDALPFIRGRYILMGDADCTYDFRDIRHFIEEFRRGAEFVMGSRFKGSIEDGAMPALHRYFGTPLTTWILNVMYRTHFTDIHCGMRGITRDGFERMRLTSQSWEYASEMVLKSVHLGLLTSEVPVRFLKDQNGRLSHHARAGWFSAWHAGWINLKAMFVFGADFFLMIPGGLLLGLGLIPLLVLLRGPIMVGGLTLSLNTMLLSLIVSSVGLQLLLSGVIAQTLYDQIGVRRRKWISLFDYTKMVAVSALFVLIGLIAELRFAAAFAESNYQMRDSLIELNHQSVFGLFLIICGVQTFVSTLMVQAIGLHVPLIGSNISKQD